MQQTRVNPYIAVIFGVIAVSFSSLFVKLSDAHPSIIAFYRMFFTFMILLPVTVYNRSRGPGRVNLRDVSLAAASGVFLALHFISWFTSLSTVV